MALFLFEKVCKYRWLTISSTRGIIELTIENRGRFCPPYKLLIIVAKDFIAKVLDCSLVSPMVNRLFHSEKCAEPPMSKFFSH